MTNLSKIGQKYLTDKGCTYFNSHCYTEIYDQYFKQYKEENRKVYILEIGIQAGYDLLMLNEYFEGNCEIYDFDIDLSKLEVELPGNIHTFELNGADIDSLNNFYNNRIKYSIYTIPQFDIIIDDGSHASNDILTSLSFLYNKLSKDGIYIIEDLHCEDSTEALYYFIFDKLNNDMTDIINVENITNNLTYKVIHYIYNSYNVSYKPSICVILQFKN